MYFASSKSTVVDLVKDSNSILNLQFLFLIPSSSFCIGCFLNSELHASFGSKHTLSTNDLLYEENVG